MSFKTFTELEKRFWNKPVIPDLFDSVITQCQQSLTESLQELAKITVSEHPELGSTYEVNQALVFLHSFGELMLQFYPKLCKVFLGKELRLVLLRICCNNEIQTTKLIKYYYSALCSVAYKSDKLPEKPNCRVKNNKILPFFGRLYKALFRRLKESDKKAITFASSVFLSRYGAITVPSSFLEEAAKKYKERLTKEPEEKQYNEKAIQLSISQFNKVTFKRFCGSLVKCLSVSACSEENKHGQYGEIEKIAPKITYENLGIKYGGICPVPYFSVSFMPEQFEGNVTYLTEPLKVRSITTSNALEFLAGKPIQDALSKNMKSMENLCFGREVSDLDISNLVKRSKDYYGTDEELLFISGDFEAATDTMSPLLSRLVDNNMINSVGLNFTIPKDSKFAFDLWNIMAKIFEYMNLENEGPRTTKKNWYRLNSWFKDRLENMAKDQPSLFVKVSEKRQDTWKGRTIIDRDNDDSFVQTFGQMMGDIKSFPVLCAINLSLWNLVNDSVQKVSWETSEIEILGTRKMDKKKLNPPCLVNGDDFLAYAPRRIIDRWFELVNEFDLTASIGKTYVSTHVAQINSTNFLLKGDRVQKIKSIPMHAVQKITADRPVDQIINYAIEHNPNLLNRLIFFNQKRINEVTGGGLINLCLPKELGGIGVKAEPKKITLRQALIAKMNQKSLRPLILKHKWVPFYKIKGKNKQKVFIYKSVPKGIGLVTDQFGIEHVLPTYQASEESRVLLGDDWLGSMSRMRFNGKRGRMIIVGEFFKKFAKISNDLVRKFKNKLDKRAPQLDLTVMPEQLDVLIKGRYRRLTTDGRVTFGDERVARVNIDPSYIYEENFTNEETEQQEN